MACDEPRLSRRELFGASAGLAVTTATPACAEAAESTASGNAAWDRFCDALKPLAQRVAAGEELERLEGLRCLTRLLSLGFDRFLEHADPTHPDFYELQTPVRKFLGDNPDQSYRVAAIDGAGRYRVRGNAAGAAGVEIGVYAGTFQSGAGAAARRLVASRDESTLALGADGGFTLTLGPEEGGANHLQLAPDANSVLIRTYFWNRDLRLAHALPRIERLDVTGPPAPLSEDALMRGLLGAVAFVDGSLGWWNAFQGTKTADNQLVAMPDDGTVQTPSRVRYLNGRVALGRDEMLLLEFTPKNEPAYWSWVLQNRFGETPDWRHRPVVCNNRDAKRDADGRVRIAIAHADPDLPDTSWLDLAGHTEMLLSLRWRGESPLPEVKTRVERVA